MTSIWRYPENNGGIPEEGREVIYIVKYDYTRKKQIGVYKWCKINEGYKLKDLVCWMYAPKNPIID